MRSKLTGGSKPWSPTCGSALPSCTPALRLQASPLLQPPNWKPSSEEAVPGQGASGEEEVGGGGQQASTPPVATIRGRQPATRGRRGARGGRGRGSRSCTRSDEGAITGFWIDNDLLIHMVEERTPLWDATDRCHADHHATQRLWLEICASIAPNWDDLNERQQEDCRSLIIVRWRSIRDRYKKEVNEEAKRPSGSG